jgi:Rho-type GTPase-activating protein 1/2
LMSLSISATSTEPPANFGRSLMKRLEALKSQYKSDLVPLTQARETLTREIAELKAVRDVFLEETTVLNARNEELAQLSAVYSRRMESVPEGPTNISDTLRTWVEKPRTQAQLTQPTALPHSLSPSTSGSSAIYEDSNVDPRYNRIQKPDTEIPTPSRGKFIKWPGSKTKEVTSPPTPAERKMHLEHNFQQLSILRFTRCDHCGDKMWGSQLRCTGEYYDQFTR